MPKITATRPLNHGMRHVGAGEELDVSATDAHYYTTRHMAVYSTRMLTAQTQVALEAPPVPVKRGRGRPPGPRRVEPTPVAPMSTASAPALAPQVEAAQAAHSLDADDSPNDDAPEERKDSETHSEPHWPPLS